MSYMWTLVLQEFVHHYFSLCVFQLGKMCFKVIQMTVTDAHKLKQEERAPLASLVEDESSREVFGLIKKLNIAPQTRRKAKPCKKINKTYIS